MNEISYRVIRSDRRTMALEITVHGELLVRAPQSMSDARIKQFVEEHRAWIDTHYKPRPAVTPLTEEEIARLKAYAREVIPPRVEEWATRMGVSHTGVTIRMQRSKWGSCSGKNHLNFNALLVLFPEWVMEYVIVHELAHCREHHHGAPFWKLVERHFPRYREAVKWLKEHGTDAICHLPTKDA